MDPVEFVRSAGGVALTRHAREAGVGDHAIRRALASGALTRPRRGWLAAPGADPMLVDAARAGVVITCVTQARRLGIWAGSDRTPHAAAPAHSGAVRASGWRVHWSRPIVLRQPGRLSDPIENVLAAVAECQPREQALATWEGALHAQLIDIGALRRLPWRPAARELLNRATPFADSGPETIIIHRLRWLPVRIVQQVWLYGSRVDLLIGERLVLQFDGGHHVGAQRERDIRHDALLRLHGYTVIRMGIGQLNDDWPGVLDVILRAIAQGLHLAPSA
ncbi:DUF559 domain-containing protein [Microbacterium sp. NPDC003461]|jgi:very-short-patch-repair endonuclease